MRAKLLAAVAAGGLFVVISTGCSRTKDAPPPAPAPVVVPPAAVVHEHVPLQRLNDAREGSTLALAKLGTRTVAYVADEDDSSIRAVDLATQKELSVTPLVGRPSQVLVGKDGRLFVALRDEQMVVVFAASKDESAPLDETAQIATAVEPIALAATPDDATLLVTSGWGHALEGFAVATLARTFAVDLAREPRAVVASNDGKSAFVSHAGAGQVSVVDLDQHAVAAIDVGMSGWTERRRRGGGLMLDFAVDGEFVDDPEPMVFRCGTGMMMRTVTFPARVARQGFALAKMSTDKADLVFAPHMQVATGDALVLSSGYGGGGSEESASLPTEMFDIDVLDAKKRTRATGPAASVGVNLRVGPTACRLPRAAVVDAAHKALYVSCLGVDKVIEYDASAKAPTGSMRRSIDVPAGPNGLALDPESSRAIVWSAFDRVVSVVALADKSTAPTAKIQLAAARAPLGEDESKGRRLFHKAGEAKIAKDGRACASCHPDGRDDGLVWSTPNGPRQTILLAGRLGRGAPYGWLGEHKSLEEHIKITMKNLKGTGVSDEEYHSLASYITTMKAPPKVKAVKLSAVEEHGSELFHGSQLGCSSCHADKTGFTDLDVHEIGSATAVDAKKQFLAPSLRFIGGSAPYFHDGRYATLDDLLRKNERMGDTKSLGDSDRAALAAYLRTL